MTWYCKCPTAGCWGKYMGLRRTSDCWMDETAEVLRKMHAPKRNEVPGERMNCRKLLHNLYSSRSIIRARHAASTGHTGLLHTGLWWGGQRERDQFEDLVVEERSKRMRSGWTVVAQEREKWQADVDTVKNLRVPYNAELLKELPTSQDSTPWS